MTIVIFKPRIRREGGRWSCYGLGKEGNGASQRGAYMDWLNEAAFPPYI